MTDEVTEPWVDPDEDAVAILEHFHDEVRASLDSLDALVASAVGGGAVDATRARDLVAFFSGPLVWHDTDEEALLLPRLKAACDDPMLNKIVEGCMRAHESMEERVENLLPALRALAAADPSPDVEALAGASGGLRRSLEPHMRLEEESIFPLAKQTMGANELRALGRKMRQRERERRRGVTRAKPLPLSSEG